MAQRYSVPDIVSPHRMMGNYVSRLDFPRQEIGRIDFHSTNSAPATIRFNNSLPEPPDSQGCFSRYFDHFFVCINWIVINRSSSFSKFLRNLLNLI
jgi:hypothetical protein